jgi:peptide/nickel transport system permease protein
VGHFLVRRFGLSVLVLFGVLVIMFVVMHLAPVDPVRQYTGIRATAEQQEQARVTLGLDKPLPVQILVYIKNFFAGDWGSSLMTKRPVLNDIGVTLPYTLELIFFSVLLTLLIGIPLGVISANRKDRLPDHASRILAVGLISIPTFWLALALQYIFSGSLGILPLSGAFSTKVALLHPITKVTGFPVIDSLVTGNFTAFTDHLNHLVLPVLAMTGISLGGTQRITRAAMVETLTEEYVVAKRSYGLPERSVLYRHALKNSIGPVITSTAVYIAAMIVSTFLIEAIFSWPGMGSYVATGVAQLDYPVIMGVTLVSAVSFLILNTLADIMLAVDPRVRLG